MADELNKTNEMAGTFGNNEQAIKDMYGGALESQKAQLKSAYDQSMASQEQAMQEVGQNYRNQQSQLASQYERNKRNLNMQAAANGLNTGAQSQMALGQANAYGAGQAQLSTAMTQQQAQIEQAKAQIENQYQNNIAKAVADNDYQLAAALLKEKQNALNDAQQKANTLANYGIYSGYENLGYSPEEITQMQDAWKFSNPDLAWQLGRITADEYYKATGRQPRGTAAPSSGGSYGGGGSGYETIPMVDAGSQGVYTDVKVDKSGNVVAANKISDSAMASEIAYRQQQYGKGK